MKFRIIKNMFKQGFEGMWRNRAMGIASISSILAVLLILGLVLILVLSINNLVINTKGKFDQVKVFLDDDIKPKDLESLENYIRSNSKIESYDFETDEEALENMKEDWGEDAYIFEGLDKNPLPNSFIVKFRNLEDSDRIVEELKKFDGVERIPYYKDEIAKLVKISEYIRIAGLIIVVALILVSIFIISNTIKITLASRRREISIMKYVGATNGYIRGPFIIEGVLFGLVAAIIAILIINVGYDYLFKVATERLAYVMSTDLLSPLDIFKDISLIFISIGVGIGALGSIFSLRKYLDV